MFYVFLRKKLQHCSVFSQKNARFSVYTKKLLTFSITILYKGKVEHQDSVTDRLPVLKWCG